MILLEFILQRQTTPFSHHGWWHGSRYIFSRYFIRDATYQLNPLICLLYILYTCVFMCESSLPAFSRVPQTHTPRACSIATFYGIFYPRICVSNSLFYGNFRTAFEFHLNFTLRVTNVRKNFVVWSIIIQYRRACPPVPIPARVRAQRRRRRKHKVNEFSSQPITRKVANK